MSNYCVMKRGFILSFLTPRESYDVELDVGTLIKVTKGELGESFFVPNKKEGLSESHTYVHPQLETALEDGRLVKNEQ